VKNKSLRSFCKVRDGVTKMKMMKKVILKTLANLFLHNIRDLILIMDLDRDQKLKRTRFRLEI